MSHSSAPETESSDGASAGREKPRVWKVGTLTYTNAGIVSLFVLLLAGDFVWSMRERSVGPMAQWYLKHLEVPNLLFGLLVTSFPALIGLILGPIISVKSDRHRGKRGRRIPFLLVTTPAATVGMIGLAFTPFLARQVHGWFPDLSDTLIALICFGVFWAVFEFATIASQAVFGGLINDVVPKPLLGRFYGLFRAIHLIDGMIFNYWIIGKVPAHYTLILFTIAVFYGFAFLWVCLKVREGSYPPPQLPQPSQRKFLGQAAEYFRDCFGKSYYVWIFLTMTASLLAFLPVNIFNMPYSISLGIDMDTYGKYLALTYLISLSLSFFLGWLVDIFHPLRVVMATLAGYAVVAFWGGLFATTQTTFLIAWVLHGVLSGCYFTSSASLGQQLFPHSRFAQFASAANMVLALGQMLIAPFMGVLIDKAPGGYRLTFAVGCALSVTALFFAWNVYRRFMRLGGPGNYVAPE